LIDQFGMLACVEHAGVAEQFQPGAVRIVHHEKSNPIGDVEIASANELAVALEICKANKIWPQHLYETRWTSTVLYVGPTRLAYGRYVETVARGDEASFVSRERVGLGGILHDFVFPEVFFLGPLHSGREHELQVFFSHSAFFEE
jgi:hypothetical protein